MNPKHFYGKVCAKHPEHNGARYSRATGNCVGCVADFAKSEAARTRRAEQHKRKWSENPEYRARMTERNKEWLKNPENRARHRAICRRWREDPEKRAQLLLSAARYRAARTGTEFLITAADVRIPTHCPVFGTPFDYSRGGVSSQRGRHAPSLDRIDPAKGYVPGNVQVISWRANQLKVDGTLDEFRRLVQFMEKTRCE